MNFRRRAGVGSLVLASSLLMAGCPGVGLTRNPVGVTATAGPSTNSASTGISATPGPIAFGTPNYPKPKPIVPPPNLTVNPKPSPEAQATGAASPGPVATGSPLVAPPLQQAALSFYEMPTLGEFAVTYYKDGGSDLVTGQAVKFVDLTAVAVDEKGSRFFTDSGNNAVRVILEQPDPVLGVAKSLQTIATTIAEKGPDGKLIAFNNPRGIALGPAGNLYVVDAGNQAVRLGTMASGLNYNFSTLAGGGAAGYADFVGKDAQFNNPYDVAVDSSGNAYVTDTNNNCIRKITPAQVVTTLAGGGPAGVSDGVGKSAGFNAPRGIAIDATGVLYVCDTGNNLIRKVTSDGVVTTFAGSGQAGFKNALTTAAQFNAPTGISVDATGTVYVSEKGSNELRKISPQGAVSTLAGTDDLSAGWVDGPGSTARFTEPRGLAVEKATGIVYAIDTGNNAMRQVQPVHAVTTLAGKGRPIQAPTLRVTNNPSLFPIVVPGSGQCCAGSTTAGNLDGTGTTAQFNEPWAVVADNAYNLYVADTGNNTIRKVTPDGTVTTLAGNGHAGFADGRGAQARFNAPRALVLDGVGNLIVADQLNNCIRKITPDGIVSTIAGDVDPAHPAGYKDGALDVAAFNNPSGVVIDAQGNLIVADRGNNVIRKITPAGKVSTIAGDGVAGYKDATVGTAARFVFPSGLAIDGKGTLYVADYGNNAIRTITPDTGAVGTLAGGGTTTGITMPGWLDGKGSAALFNEPWGLCVDGQGLLYVADYGNSLIRRIDSQGTAVTFAGAIPTGNSTVTSPTSGYADGPAIGSSFAAPAGICFDRRGFLYVADSKNHRIRKIY